MMKRKFLAVVLPIIGCATVVGSGFSAWYFGNNVGIGNISGSTPVNVNVTEELEDATGTLSVDTTATTITGKSLILDQGGPKNDSLDSGIMFGDATAIKTIKTDGNKWDFTVYYNKGDAGEGLTLGELYDAGLRIRINLSIEIKGDLGKYITFQDSEPDSEPIVVSVAPTGLTGTGNAVTLTGTGAKRSADYTITDAQVNGSGLTTASWNFALGVDTQLKENGDYSNALLKYQDRVYDGTYKGGKPGDEGEPLSMKTDLTNDPGNPSQIVFSVTAFIEDDPDNLTNN